MTGWSLADRLFVRVLSGRPRPDAPYGDDQRVCLFGVNLAFDALEVELAPGGNYGSTTAWWTLETEPAFTNKPSGNLNGGLGPFGWNAWKAL